MGHGEWRECPEKAVPLGMFLLAVRTRVWARRTVLPQGEQVTARRPCDACGGTGGVSPFTPDGYYCPSTACDACGGIGVQVLGQACLPDRHIIGCDCEPCEVCNERPCDSCPCCGALGDCPCLIYDFEGYDRESGYFSEKRCTTHGARV